MDLLRPRRSGESFSRTCLLDLSSVVLVLLSVYVVLELWLLYVVSTPSIVMFLTSTQNPFLFDHFSCQYQEPLRLQKVGMN
jgi:hypothetical protein